jgi:hypothetical protein
MKQRMILKGRNNMKTICRQEAIDDIYTAINDRIVFTLKTIIELIDKPYGKNGLQRKNNEYIERQLEQWTGRKEKVINRTMKGGKGSRS